MTHAFKLGWLREQSLKKDRWLDLNIRRPFRDIRREVRLAARAKIGKGTWKMPWSKWNLLLNSGILSSACVDAIQAVWEERSKMNRGLWSLISVVSLVFNCTPAKVDTDESNEFIDSDPTSKTGLALSRTQAGFQFTLYTGRPAPERIFSCPQ